MEDTGEGLREKERELEAVRKQVEALRIVAPLLVDAGETIPKMPTQSESWASRRNGTTDSSPSQEFR